MPKSRVARDSNKLISDNVFKKEVKPARFQRDPKRITDGVGTGPFFKNSASVIFGKDHRKKNNAFRCMTAGESSRRS